MKKENSLLFDRSRNDGIEWQRICASAFSLSSADIPADFRLTQQHVLKGFGCSGENISPQLSWRNPPAGTKSYAAITVFDPDAPTGSGWRHWTMVNIPAQIHDLPMGTDKNTLPTGVVQGRNDFGYAGFGGELGKVMLKCM